MFIKSLLNIVHFLVLLFIICIPLLPNNILKYAVFFPSFLYVIWIIYDGCPITHITHGPGENFIKNLVDKIFPDSNIETEYVNGLGMTLILAIVAYRKIVANKK